MSGKQSEISFSYGVTVHVTPGTTILEAARQAGLRLEAPCDGRRRCGKCRVRVSGDVAPPDPEETGILAKAPNLGGRPEDWRLACRARVTGSALVQLDLDSERVETVHSGSCRSYPLDPPALGRLGGTPRSDLPVPGIALDLGTTTMVAALVDLRTGRDLAVRSCLNPQAAFGGDVITRITHATRNGSEGLQREAARALGALAAGLCTETGLPAEAIHEVTVAGNTTMLHLLAGENPRSLAVAPYQPVFTAAREIPAASLGLDFAPGAVVTLIPSLSAFVGADILAGVAASGLHTLPYPALFIDIGTNGEIVASAHGRLVGTSCAAGPAFEGMNITHGCRAEIGAVSGFSLRCDGGVHVETIGGARAKGICGSGLVDIAAELVRWGVVLPNGRFAPPGQEPPEFADRIGEHAGQRCFWITPEVCLTQRDVRQVQLAKGAIATGFTLLLERLELPVAEVRKVLVAGSFGAHLNPRSITGIGLVPPELGDRIQFVGNTAKEGAKLYLTSRAARADMEAIREGLQVEELSLHPDFQDRFVKALGFPAPAAEPVEPAAASASRDRQLPVQGASL